MGIIAWIIMGALAGWIASMIMGTNEEQGAVANIVIGIIGAFIGGFISSSLGGPTASGFNLVSLLVAIGGAVILLFVVNLFRKGKAPSGI